MSEYIDLLFLPGSLCDEQLFKHQIDYFEDSQWPFSRIRVADLAGHSSIQRMAVQALCSTRNDIVLVGLSMGALVALEMVRIAPERVIGLALLGSNPGAPEPHQISARTEQLQRIQQSSNDVFHKLCNELAEQFLYREQVHMKPMVSHMLQRAGKLTLVNHWKAINDRSDLMGSLSRIAVPCLVLGGEQDTVCQPSIQRSIHKHINGATLSLIPNCGHLPSLEAPHQVNNSLAALFSETLHNKSRISA